MDISNLKPHKGQLDSASTLNKLLENSNVMASHEDCGRVQDPYSLRCAPQVHGACKQTLQHALEVINTELNSVTDNPLIFADQKKVNYKGEIISEG